MGRRGDKNETGNSLAIELVQFRVIPRLGKGEQFDINVFGMMDVTRAILPHFRKNKGGLIVSVSSGAGIFTLPMISLYCASKFALEGFSEALAYELASLHPSISFAASFPHPTSNTFSTSSP
jgi:short-subunit dehydrogenase